MQLNKLIYLSKSHFQFPRMQHFQNRLPTFVQFVIDVFGKLLCGFYVRWVNIQCSAVWPTCVSQLHRIFTNIQDVSPEVLNLRVLNKVKLTHRHTDGKTWQSRKSYCD